MPGKPLLPAPTPDAWRAAHLAPRFERHDDETSAGGRWLDLADLLADDGAELRAGHGRLLTQDVPAAAAAHYVVGWFGGQLAWAVGFGLAAAGAGFVVDPLAVRWHRHADGWCNRVDLGAPTVVVAAEHPWAGLPGVVVGDPIREAVGAMVAAVAPIVDVCHGLARTGLAGLWNEVSDSLGMAVAHDLGLPVDDAAVAALREAVGLDGAPWRARPEVRIVDSRIGRRYIGRKGGCCLAYTEPCSSLEPGGDTPLYCSTCSFRSWDDVEERQLAWLEEQRSSPAADDA